MRIPNASEPLPALKAAIASGKPTVLDVAMINNPTPQPDIGTSLTSIPPAKTYHTSKHDKKATQIVRIPPVITPFDLRDKMVFSSDIHLRYSFYAFIIQFFHLSVTID